MRLYGMAQRCFRASGARVHCAPMPVEWLRGEVQKRCPVCGVDGPKSVVLTTDNVLPTARRITLLRCSSCGAAFLDDLTAPDYGGDTPEMLDYYVEQGAGLDLIVAPLLRVPPATVRRALEIGCSFPFALDFSRFAFGWDVLGVDPSPLAAKGAVALGVPVLHSYFDAELDVGPEPFDLVLCSEIIEHVADAHALLSSIRARLSADGVLVLSTPNAEIVRKETEEGMLARALSAGFHLVLYDRRALAHVLTKAGFTSIEIDESPETLRAFAACSPAPIERLLAPDPDAERALLRRYLSARMKEVAPSSIVASGFAYRYFKECVNAGLYDEAVESRAYLAHVYQERYGIDLHEPDAWSAAAAIPFNLSCALFFCGILELNALQRPDRAAAYFAAAIAAAERIRASPCPFALHDGETEMLLRQSRKHLPMALAATEPERAVRELARLDEMDRASFPDELLEETYAQTFVRLVNAGAYENAAEIAPRIARIIERDPPEQSAGSSGSLDALYCLAMLALQRGRSGEAAELFRRVAMAAEASGASAQQELLRSARYHERLSREQAAAHG